MDLSEIAFTMILGTTCMRPSVNRADNVGDLLVTLRRGLGCWHGVLIRAEPLTRHLRLRGQSRAHFDTRVA